MTDTIAMRRPGVLVLAAMLATVGTAAAQDAGSGAPPPVRLMRPVAANPQAQALNPDAIRLVRQDPAAYAPPADAVVLRNPDVGASLKALGATRQLELPALRAQPRVQLGRGVVDMTPLLANPQALPNVAERLRARPQLAEVTVDSTRAFEIPQGLVVQSVLAYRLRPGACTDAGRRAQVESTGIECFTRQDEARRAAAFADPKDAHYVADPAARTRALERASQQAATLRADAATDLANLRQMLADPAQRGAIEAEIGAGEAARLASLGDEELEREVVNTGETQIEQVMFVPTTGRVDPAKYPKLAGFGEVRTPEAAPGLPFTLPVQGQMANKLESQVAVESNVPPPTNATLAPQVFLTGFTLGREYEWRQRVETSIKWCLVGCKKTYFAELFAGFKYGFGLRFPVRLTGTYQRTGKKATLIPQFVPINGSAVDYSTTGLPGSQLFNGKELVAEFGAWAGAAYKVPVLGEGGVRVEVGKDFTEWLPPPLKGGQFEPPAAKKTLGIQPMIFDTVDLIGGRANFGVAGGQVFPALKIDLYSDSLTFKVRDEFANGASTVVSNGDTVALKVDPTKYSSSFTIGDPVYNLSFLLTPGIDARLFIDVSVWSASWDWPVWFPQLAVQLPPGGVDFACHANTECRRPYLVTPKGIVSGPGAAFIGDLGAWAGAFESEYLGQCTDDICRTGIRLVSLNATLLGQQKLDAVLAQIDAAGQKPAPDASPVGMADMKPVLDQSVATAKTMVKESQVRLTQSASRGWAILAQAVWSKKCQDLRCMDDVAALATEMEQVAVQRMKDDQTDASSLAIQGQVGKEYGAKFQGLIDASNARAVAAAAAKATPVGAVSPAGPRPIRIQPAIVPKQ